MPSPHWPQPPAACRWLLRPASLLVPPETRAAWRRRWYSSLHSLWILAGRGELPGSDSTFLAWCWYKDALANAFKTHWGAFDPRRWMRAPGFPMAAATVALALIALATHGFAITRSLPDGPTQDRLVANLFPIAFAIAASAMAAIGRISPGGRGWRYHSFFLLKTLSLALIETLVWIEGGAALRASISNLTLRVLAGGLLLAVVFVATFGWAMLWSLADQRHRCPVCLRRLVMPVRIGSWASVFEPVTTEWICEAGHGSLCVREASAAGPCHWFHLESALQSCDPAPNSTFASE